MKISARNWTTFIWNDIYRKAGYFDLNSKLDIYWILWIWNDDEFSTETVYNIDGWFDFTYPKFGENNSRNLKIKKHEELVNHFNEQL